MLFLYMRMLLIMGVTLYTSRVVLRVLGVEDFGIFPIEAMSCGTPVLYYKYGGVCESVIDGKTGIGIDKLDIESFKKSLELFKNTEWNYKSIAKYSKKFSKERFKREIKRIVNSLL